jgi:hypothetical protein
MALSFQLSDKDAVAAAALDREAIELARAVGEPEAIAWAMVRSNWVPWIAGDLETQRRVLADAYAYIEFSGAQSALGEALKGLRENACERGAFQAARRSSARLQYKVSRRPRGCGVTSTLRSGSRASPSSLRPMRARASGSDPISRTWPRGSSRRATRPARERPSRLRSALSTAPHCKPFAPKCGPSWPGRS